MLSFCARRIEIKSIFFMAQSLLQSFRSEEIPVFTDYAVEEAMTARVVGPWQEADSPEQA